MDKATVRDVEMGGKRVLMRVDFNVPMKDGRITDDSRIRATLPTIRYILEKNAILILMSHLGRPDGKVVDKYSLKPVSVRLSELLGKPVKMMNDCIGPDVDDVISKAVPGDVILLENLRFYPGEEENNEDFARSLARHGDIYVNDAFGTAHRAHASTAGVAKFLTAVAGFLMEKEIEYLGKAMESPRKPFVAILGGAKVSDKIGVIRNLLSKVDAILIGGGMAFTFLKVQGYPIGNSLLDEKEDLASSTLIEAKARKVEIKLPLDIVVAEKVEDRVPYKVVSAKNIPDGWIGVDIGPQTIEEFSKVIKTAKTI
ncbi:MAG: phosphoglycerate kinase, partial [Firmicutes bacterium]|nr:phosphoglycerate kinase [Bacillota bacterium]